MVHDASRSDLSSEFFQSRWITSNSGDDDDASAGAPPLPAAIASAEYHAAAPRPGMEIYSFKANLRSNLDMICEPVDDRPYLWIAMNFKGHCAYSQSASIHGNAEDNRGYLSLLREPPIRLEYAPGEHHSAGLSVSQERLAAILQDRIDDCRISKFIEGRFSPEVICHGSTETMRRIGEQIQSNPYEGVMRDVYLEGKALEILAEVFQVALDGGRKEEKRNNRRCAFEAREIMMQDLHTPPFIADVAKKVGVSQKKLIDIFREVFGATPLQCLVLWRLEQARQILQDGQFSIKQVSYMVGYNYESNFSNAFTRHFGFPPSHMARQHAR